jgi:hypothetical protein
MDVGCPQVGNQGGVLGVGRALGRTEGASASAPPQAQSRTEYGPRLLHVPTVRAATSAMCAAALRSWGCR